MSTAFEQLKSKAQTSNKADSGQLKTENTRISSFEQLRQRNSLRVQPAVPRVTEESDQDGIVKSIFKSIVKPVATLVARPVQLGKAFAGATEEEQAVNLPFGLGKVETVKTGKDVIKDVGRGLETVSLGVGGALPKVAKAGNFGKTLKTVSTAIAKPSIAPTITRGLTAQPVKEAVKQGFKVGAKSGALYGAGEATERTGDFSETAQGAFKGAVAGGVIGGALPVAFSVPRKVVNRMMAPKLARVQKDINREATELLSKTRGIINKSQVMVEGRNIPVDKYMKDPIIFRGLKVDNSRIVPDDAIQSVKSRTDALMDAKSKLLPELDRITTKVPKTAIRERAIANLKGTPADIADDVTRIDKQLAALPEELSVSQVDNFRAQVRQSARAAKGVSKINEYSALEKASRDTVFDVTDNLPFDTNKEYQAINDEIKNLIGMEEFLDKTIRGQIVKGGRLTNVVGRIVGAVAGSKGGVLGSIAGSELGGAVADIITNNQLGSSMKMKLIQNLTDDPLIIKEAEKLLLKTKNYNLPRLTGPTTRERIEGKVIERGFGSTKKPLELPAKSASTIELEESARIQNQAFQRSQGKDITPKERSVIQQTTKSTPESPISKSVPKIKTDDNQSLFGKTTPKVASVITAASSIPITYGYLEKKFGTTRYERAEESTPPLDVSTITKAIAHNETRGVEKPYELRKPSGSKSLGDDMGKYQITEGELKTYAKRFLGKTVSASEFMKSPELQDRYIKNKIEWLHKNYGWTIDEILAAHRGGMSKPDEIDRIKRERKSYIDSAKEFISNNK